MNVRTAWSTRVHARGEGRRDEAGKRIDALTRLRVGGDSVHAPILTTLRTLARRLQNLTGEHTALTWALDALLTSLNPGPRAAYGVGPDTAAQLLITLRGPRGQRGTTRSRSSGWPAMGCHARGPGR